MPVAVKKFIQIFLIVLTFMALAFASAVLTMKAFTWSHTVTVPDVRGMELTVAINKIRNAGLDIKVERQEHHPTVPQNCIIGQDPAPGDSVKSGRNVMVIVSLGSQEVTVPPVTNQIFRLAQVTLQGAGLELGDVARVNAPPPQETVFLQSPAQGTVLQQGSDVDALVSAGMRAAQYVTPDLRGMTLPEAGDAVKSMGGKVLYSGRGSVIATQSPMAGYQLPANGQIIVALGELPKPRPAAPPAPLAAGQAAKNKPAKAASAPVPVAQKSKAPAPPAMHEFSPVFQQVNKSKQTAAKPPARQPVKTDNLLHPMGN